jgi:hypothetical protein
MPAAVWLQYHPALYIPIFATAGVAHGYPAGAGGVAAPLS